MRLLNIIRWIRTFVREKFHSRNENIPYYITLGIAAVVFTVGIYAFIELTDELAENDLGAFDQTVTEYVVSFRSEELTSYFKTTTHLGDRNSYIALILLLSVYLIFRKKHWKFITQTVAVLLLATLSNIMLKQYINRARPSLQHLVEVNTLSYPSGHSMSAMAFYGFLIYLCTQAKMPGWLRILLIVILGIVIASIGLSRIYLGVHFPSDVVAGWIGGLIWVAFCAFAFNVIDLLIKRRKSKKDQTITGLI